MEMTGKKLQRIYGMSVSRVYPLYIAKVERKGHTKAEVMKLFIG